MKTFVTGATGLLGNNLVQQLLEQGHVVKALVRSPRKAETVLPEHKNLTIIEGDMDDTCTSKARCWPSRPSSSFCSVAIYP